MLEFYCTDLPRSRKLVHIEIQNMASHCTKNEVLHYGFLK